MTEGALDKPRMVRVPGGVAPPGVEPAAEFDSTRGNLPDPDIVRIDRLIALS